MKIYFSEIIFDKNIFKFYKNNSNILKNCSIEINISKRGKSNIKV